ncbi:alpha/beta hydrolase [Brevibacillus humidisoli]|uniref:alpha/beta hydrolase n=1 Tax=Brevibacillus humidisoli TaxID=2895522 RepID=UPI001E5A2138|nr:alpha/beta fold hydrolase [Brevibacillus humidisoli]UFJ42412.1 alpha/beta hydrolase [Brevibacillus humidisoli]
MWTQVRFGGDQGIYGVVEKAEQSSGPQPLVISFAGLGQAMSEKNYLFSNMRKRMAEYGQWFVQFDYRGYGDSYGELGDASLTSMLEDARDVLEQVTSVEQPSKIYLVGNALGAIIAQELALWWEEKKNIPCLPILISPPLQMLPHSTEIFAADDLARIAAEGKIDSQQLVPGYDYYTLSDFRPDQYEYVTRLGAHLLYLHGQCVGKKMIEQLDQLDPAELFRKSGRICPLICGENDELTIQLAEQLGVFHLHLLSGVTYYHQHPAAMDQLIAIVQSIVREDLKSC